MKNYNDNNIKNILSLINGKGLASTSRIIKLANKKYGINQNEVIDSIELLLDLDVIKEKKVTTGDGWNTIGTCKIYELA